MESIWSNRPIIRRPMSAIRHLHFGESPNLKNLYPTLKRLVDPQGRYEYAGWNPEMSTLPTEDQKQLLAEYQPVMPIITFQGSEKLHGENMAVAFSQDELWVQGRNNVRTIEQDQNGMALFVESTKDIWLKIIKHLTVLHEIDTNTHTIVIDCEWAGGNIQKGNAACSGVDKGAYIFDYFRVITNDSDESTYKSTRSIIPPRNSNIYLMSSFSSYTLVLDFNDVSKCETDLEALALSIEKASPIARYFNKPTNVGEGAYLWAKYDGRVLRLKTKGEAHGGKSKAPRVKSEKDIAEELMLKDLADKVTPVWRITQGITETSASEMKHLGPLIKWVISDVVKEETPTLVEANVEIKILSRYISAIVKNYFNDYLLK